MKAHAAVLCVLALASAKTENHNQNYRVWESKLNYIQNQLATNHTWKEAWEESVRKYEESAKIPLPIIPFTCTNIAGPGPSNIHQLRPQDISVVGALGDSITAGFALDAETIGDLFIQLRGEAFSIGVDGSLEEEVLTFTNVLKKFNPNLKGGSTGTGWDTDPNSWLNVAISGSKANDMPTQAGRIVDRINRDSEIDADNDWKLLTLFIGTNDFCQDCRLDPAFRHAENIVEALTILHDGLSRTMVQVVAMLDVAPLRSLSTGFMCDILQPIMCPCGANDNDRPLLKPIQMDVYNYLQETIEGGYFDDRDDFTVVLQPSLVHSTPPIDPETGETDKTYWSPDCFHPGRKGHQAVSYVLWNTMMTKVGEKPLDYPLESESERSFKCPTQAEPYIWTNVNSATSKMHNAAAYAASHPRYNNKNNIAGIVGGVIGAIVGISLIVVIAAVVYQRRKLTKDHANLDAGSH